MTTASAWAPVGPGRLGLYTAPPAQSAAAASGLHSVASPGETSTTGLLSLDNPLLPIFAIGGLALGLIAFSTAGSVSFRLGKATATVGGGAGVGSTK